MDGSQHESNVEYDEARTAVLEHAGYRVIRFPNRRVLFGFQGVVDEILAELRLARP
jgi:very-short-patch-repair endonuclease